MSVTADALADLTLGLAGKLSRVQFKARTFRQRTVVNVGTSATQVLKLNADRLGWAIVNRSPDDGAIDFLPSIAFATAILLGATGGGASMSFLEDGEACTDEVWGINNGAAGNWNVLEIIAYREDMGA